jgi:hypothetical protein
MSLKKAKKKVAAKVQRTRIIPEELKAKPVKKEVEPEGTPEGEQTGELLVKYYKNGLSITIKDCSAKMLMIAVEEIVAKYIVTTEKK